MCQFQSLTGCVPNDLWNDFGFAPMTADLMRGTQIENWRLSCYIHASFVSLPRKYSSPVFPFSWVSYVAIFKDIRSHNFGFQSKTFWFDKRIIQREALRHWSLGDFLQGWWPTVCRGLVPPNSSFRHRIKVKSNKSSYKSVGHLCVGAWSPQTRQKSNSYFRSDLIALHCWMIRVLIVLLMFTWVSQKIRCYWIWSYFDVVGKRWILWFMLHVWFSFQPL